MNPFEQLGVYLSMLPQVLPAIVYSWIPALLLLVFLCFAKPSTRVAPAVIGLLLGSYTAGAAGYLNQFSFSELHLGEENWSFFASVGIFEECIKSFSSFGGMFVFWLWQLLFNQNAQAKAPLNEPFRANWLAQGFSGALGFAAAENFVYGIDGQGGVSRIIPLFAHLCFASFWCLGYQRFLLDKNRLSGLFFLLVGFAESVVLHLLYNSLVSEDLLKPELKVIFGIMTLVLVGAVLLFHLMQNESLKEAEPLVESNAPTPEATPRASLEADQSKASMWLPSIAVPGLAFFVRRKDFLRGLTFLGLSLVTLYLIFSMAGLELTQRMSKQNWEQSEIIGFAALTLFLAALGHLAIGFWAAWEEAQLGLVESKEAKQRRHRLPIYALSALFLLSIMTGIFLPVIAKGRYESDESEKKLGTIQEIPLGLNWEVENEQAKPNSDQRKGQGQIELDDPELTSPTEKRKTSTEEGLETEASRGVQNSENLSPNPIAKPEGKGYIGVQLSERFLEGGPRPFIIYVYPKTSAERSGLKAGDFILAVNGASTEGVSAPEVSERIRGSFGTSVSLEILRPDEGHLRVTAERTGAIFDQ